MTQQNEISAEKPAVGFFTKLIASGLYTGYSPFASGTVGSAVAVAFFFLPGFQNPYLLFPLTVALFIVGGITAAKMESHLGQDPGEVTVDEFVGMWISLWFIPPTAVTIALAFIIFRILDILKPYPAQIFDNQKGGWNIMLDDVVAGIYTNIILQIALHWF